MSPSCAKDIDIEYPKSDRRAKEALEFFFSGSWTTGPQSCSCSYILFAFVLRIFTSAMYECFTVCDAKLVLSGEYILNGHQVWNWSDTTSTSAKLCKMRVVRHPRFAPLSDFSVQEWEDTIEATAMCHSEWSDIFGFHIHLFIFDLPNLSVGS